MHDIESTRHPLEILPLDQLHPRANQPRWTFDQIDELARSILKKGVLQPLIVRPSASRPGQYEIIAGERRYRASHVAAATNPARRHVPCIVTRMSDAEADEAGVTENLQRVNLNPLELIHAVARLTAGQFGVTVPDAVALLNRLARDPASDPQAVENVEYLFSLLNAGNWRSFVTNKLPLLNAAEVLKDALRSGRLDYTKARALMPLKREADLRRVLAESLEGNLSVEAIRQRVRDAQGERSNPNALHSAKRALNERQYRRLDPARRARVDDLLRELERLLTEAPPAH